MLKVSTIVEKGNAYLQQIFEDVSKKLSCLLNIQKMEFFRLYKQCLVVPVDSFCVLNNSTYDFVSKIQISFKLYVTVFFYRRSKFERTLECLIFNYFSQLEICFFGSQTFLLDAHSNIYKTEV